MARISPGRVVLWLCLCLCAAPAAALAQTTSSTTGAINGKVTDNTNAVLPGVTVTISGSTLMGTRTALTGEDGTFRFAAVPPGDYAVKFELAGFGTMVREGIRV